MDTVLVTGAFGLVGSATVRRLADDGRFTANLKRRRGTPPHLSLALAG